LKKFALIAALFAAIPSVLLTQTAVAQKADPANTLVIELKSGNVLIGLRPDLAPKHVERIKMLAKEGFYNNIKFHRVITGFMAQTGDPKGTGSGGSKYPNLPAEFTQEPYVRGTIGAARTQDPNSSNSQFFICFTDQGCRSLTGQYTVWGKVIEGMEHVDQIARGEPPAAPDVMQKVYILADKK
jgi:peptidylprolyl isomerase